MSKKIYNTEKLFLAIYFSFWAICLLVGTFYDLKIELFLFDPQSTFSRVVEVWSELPRYLSIAFSGSILFFNIKTLGDILNLIGLQKFSNYNGRIFCFFDFIIKAFQYILWLFIAVIGWHKTIFSIGKYYFVSKDNYYFSMSKSKDEVIWYIVSVFIATAFLYIVSKIPVKIIRKLIPIAYLSVLLNLAFFSCEFLKDLSARVRFRDMVAFSFGIPDAKSECLSKMLAKNCNTSLFTNWYQKGNGGAFLNGFKAKGGSFPSGHIWGASFIFLLPIILKNFKKTDFLYTSFLLISSVYVAVVGYTRLVRGAHFLSDIAVGAIISMLFIMLSVLIIKIVQNKLKKLNKVCFY